MIALIGIAFTFVVTITNIQQNSVNRKTNFSTYSAYFYFLSLALLVALASMGIEKGTIKDDVLQKAMEIPQIQKYVDKAIERIIFVPDKILNICVTITSGFPRPFYSFIFTLMLSSSLKG
jgi:hypothetical protein